MAQAKRKCEHCGREFTPEDTYYARTHVRRFCSLGCRNRANGLTVKRSLEIRLWSKIERKGPKECWEWKASRSGRYGKLKGKHAHRVLYELLIGPVPEGMELDHVCRNRYCVNPAHLEPVTHAENIRRHWEARKLK